MKIKKNFTQIPNKVLSSSPLSVPARYLMCVLLRYMMQKDFCFPSQKLLANDLNYSARYIRTLLKELVTHGYIRKVRTGFNKSNTYILGSKLEGNYTSPDRGRVSPVHKGSKVPTNNTNERIINKKKLDRINKIREKAIKRIQ